MARGALSSAIQRQNRALEPIRSGRSWLQAKQQAARRLLHRLEPVTVCATHHGAPLPISKITASAVRHRLPQIRTHCDQVGLHARGLEPAPERLHLFTAVILAVREQHQHTITLACPLKDVDGEVDRLRQVGPTDR